MAGCGPVGGVRERVRRSVDAARWAVHASVSGGRWMRGGGVEEAEWTATRKLRALGGVLTQHRFGHSKLVAHSFLQKLFEDLFRKCVPIILMFAFALYPLRFLS